MTQTQFPPRSAHTSSEEQPEANGFAITGLVLAVIALAVSWMPIVNIFGMLLTLIGLALGIVGLVRSRQRNTGKGLPIAAIVLAVAAFVASSATNAFYMNG